MKHLKSTMFIALLFCCVFFSPAADAAKKKTPVPALSAITAEQAGDSQIVLTLEGTALSRPEAVSGEDGELCLLLPGVAFPAGEYVKTPDAPLVPQIRVRHTADGALLTLYCEAPLRIAGVRGAGTRQMKIRLARAALPAEENIATLFTDAASPFVSSEKITLELENATLAETLRLLGERAGVNILIDSTAKQDARITLLFRGAPFDEVLSFILAAQNLDCRKSGRTLIIAAKNSPALITGSVSAKSYRVAYADVQKTAPLLKELAGLTLSANKIIVDERRNALIVTATESQHRRIAQALKTIDAPPQQVMIKARIIEVSDDATDDLETALNAVYDWFWASYQSGQLSAGAAHSSGVTDGNSLPNIDTSSDLPGTIGSGIAELPGTVSHVLDFRISALVEQQRARVVADPTVVAIDGEKAVIKLVDKLKYVSRRDDANNPTYDDEEVGPTLEVTPRVGRGGNVTVTLTLSTGEVVEWLSGSQGEEVPQTNTRSVSTTVRIRSGEPFVVGGLYKDSVTRSKAGVPVLQNIPLLGNLFQSRTVKKTRSQVVMILVPFVLDGAE